MAQPPNSNVPIAEPQSGRCTIAWQAFFAALSGQGAAKSTIIAPDGSPYTYTAPSGGHLVVQGEITGLALIRGRDPIALAPFLSMIPLSKGDRAVLTYTAAPGLVFLPA
jgi:hypothetical protein